MAIPEQLVDEIQAGNCVAFVGAGFSAPVVPHWGTLLVALAAEADDPTRGQVERLVAAQTGKDFEAAAQIVRDALGPERFAVALRSALEVHPIGDRMERRLELLQGIPFRAVLTTNFDGLLPGALPGRDAYLGVLRPGGHRWWDSRYWAAAGERRPDVVQLHGSIRHPERVVFTRQDYRHHLYSSPGYVTFLRSVMATTTVLYLGFSFTDAYLDELRSEVLALLDYRGGDKPIAYALLNDVTQDEVAYARRHEGIEIISYPSIPDYQGFDDTLTEIHAATNPRLLLGRLIAGKRIVWVDPNKKANDYGFEFLTGAAQAAGGTTIDQVTDVDEALDTIANHGADLVITRWGHGLGPAGSSTAEHLLTQIRKQNLPTPVTVFASGDHADDNKRSSLALGATSYEYTWEGLFQEIERIFSPASTRR